MFVNTNQLLLELDGEMHQNNVLGTIQSFGMYDMKNVVIYCSNGEAVFTTKKFLGVFSGLIRDICRDFPQQETINIFVPFPRDYVENMIEYLNQGKLVSRDMDKLTAVIELIQSFGINVDLAEIVELNNRPQPKKRKNMEKDSIENGTSEVKEKRKYNKKKKVAKIEPGELDEFGEILQEENEDKKETKEKEYQCNHCDKAFTTQSSFKQHLVVHTKEKKFECLECGKTFGTQAILYNHKGVHNPIKCEHCDKPFSQKANYKNHLRSVHNIDDSK